MNDYHNKPRDCTPTENPAQQPKPPVDDWCDKCKPDKPPTVPAPKDPDPCEPPPEKCKCPPAPTDTTDCLEDAIEEQGKLLAQAEIAKTFKADLEARLKKATTAAQQYTQDAYEKLLKRWQEEDRAIVELIRKLTCAVPCWHCLIECYVCPILNALHYNEQRLSGKETLPAAVNNLYEYQYWLKRDAAAKDATVASITRVMDAWASPVATVDGVLNANSALLASCSQNLGTTPGAVVFDVFLNLIPMHLAIAPPADDPATTTGIDKSYTVFCGCDVGKPDDCCGPDTGVLSLRQRILGPQPYLVKPGELFKVICCLVKNRYQHAKNAATDAAALLASTNEKITRLQNQLDAGLKSFNTDARAAIPTQFECCNENYDAQKQPK